MKLSLRWKVLAWAFVNLALIGVGVCFFLRAQFHVGIESLLAGPTGARLDAIARPLAMQIQATAESEWPAALERATGEWRAHGVKVALFKNTGRFVAGDIRTLPADVFALLDAHDVKMRGVGGGRPPGERREPPERGGTPRREPPPSRPPGAASATQDGLARIPAPAETSPRERTRREPPPDAPQGPGVSGAPDGPQPRTTGAAAERFEKFMLIAGTPRLYWAGVHLDSSSAGRLSVTLFLASDSIRGGGLFFDYVPWLWLGGTIVLGSVLLWLPFVHRLTRSISGLTCTAEKIAEGNFEPPPETRRSDEIGRLHNAHRHMAQRLDSYVTGQKRFLGDTAHELLSPLARLEVALSILEQRSAQADRAYTERALGEVQHISALVHELLAFSKTSLAARGTKLEPVALAALAHETVQREASNAPIEFAIAADLRANATPALLARALGNILRNAARYAPGPIRIAAEQRGDAITLTISDEGPGVPADALPRIFDPFFRPDTSRTSDTGGTGLGLAIVKSSVEACGGSVTARNREPQGFEIIVTLLAEA